MTPAQEIARGLDNGPQVHPRSPAGPAANGGHIIRGNCPTYGHGYIGTKIDAAIDYLDANGFASPDSCITIDRAALARYCVTH